MADYRARLQRAGKHVLQPGEPILAAVRAATEGSPLGALGGVVVLLALSADHRDRAKEQGFPASMNMILGTTDRRLLVFRASVLHRLPALLGEVPFEGLQDVRVERRGMSPRLRFVLASGAELTFTTYRLDKPERFVEALHRARAARPKSGSSVPPPLPIPVVPPPPPR
jgi:hypothetical protein